METGYCIEVLERAGVTLEPGLTPQELLAAEGRFAFTFPPDLRELLAVALPSGERWPDWRHLDTPELRGRMAWPLEGMCFDIEHDVFWPKEWGSRPDLLEEAFAIARTRFESVPRLIPVHGHRYIPDHPALAGNPIFSVYQTDIIVYGADLPEYLRNEFERTHDGSGDSWQVAPDVREIAFWSRLVELNNSLSSDGID